MSFGMVTTDHRFTVPLDHAEPDGARISLFAREVVAPDNVGKDLPWLLFLGGGPGNESPRPFGGERWLTRAMRDYRVLLLDQRGTGLSTPLNRRTLTRLGDARAQADHLVRFRADSIVRDAESIRRALIGDEPWTVLGQSFGGLCTFNYLSFAPEGALREVFVTGGTPGLNVTADDVYRVTYPLVAARNATYYERYPEDVETVRRVVRYLRENEVRLPSGITLTAEAFQSLGGVLGRSTGARQLHYLLEYAFVDGPEPSDVFLAQVDGMLSIAATPLYALLHEATYADGPMATRWSAERVRAEFPEFDADAALAGDAPVFLTGEMIYPWMLDVDPALRPLREAAELLARRSDWPPLYDVDRLRGNTVPITAALYHDDMYVPFDLSIRTARTVKGFRAWVTNEYEHDGLRHGPVLDHLIALARGDA